MPSSYQQNIILIKTYPKIFIATDSGIYTLQSAGLFFKLYNSSELVSLMATNISHNIPLINASWQIKW